MRRREFVAQTGVAFGSLTHLASRSAAATGGEPYDKLYPDMLAAYMTARLNRLATEWDGKRAAIRTAEEMRSRNAFVRKTVIEMVGGFPERNPLGARIVRVIERPGYRVENVMFQSRPDFWVTGNLYIPSGGSGKRPAIISPCGHYPLARMLPQYQIAYQHLAKSGFIVLAFDPIGQGERRQYWNPETGVTEVGSATTEHSMVGQMLLLFGDTLTGYRIWDAMRAVDYLETRPEVDTTRIGCTGHSGGGTLTLFTSAVDERIQCAVVHEGGTRGRWPIRLAPFGPLGPSDVEQNLFPAALHGIDSPDLHAAIAPRPLMATIEHFSPEFQSAADRVRDRYRLLDVPERFAAVEAGDPHAWTHKLRLATADWFSRWFHRQPAPSVESELTPERPEDLRCTPNGSIRYSKQGETAWTTVWRKSAQFVPARTPTAADAIRSLLKLPALNGPLEPRHVETVPREGYAIEKVAFLSEPAIYIPTWVFQPKQRKPGLPAILYFNESGKDSDGMEFENAEAAGLQYGVLATLCKRGYQVIAADARGVGETRTPHRPNSSGSPFQHLFDSETALAYMAWFMDESLFGMRVADVLRTVDYALSRTDAGGGGRVWVVGKDMAALLVLFAAALDPRIEAAVCHRGLLSYRALTQDGVDRYLHGANVLVRRVLSAFDLPDVAAAAAARSRLSILTPVDAMKQPVAAERAEMAYKATAGRLRMEMAAEPDLAAHYMRLLASDSFPVR